MRTYGSVGTAKRSSGLTLGILTFGLLAATGCGSSDEPSPSPEPETATPTAAPTEAPTATPTAKPLVVPEGCTTAVYPSGDAATDQSEVQEAILLAASGDTVCLVDGPFQFLGEISVASDGLTLKGVNTQGSERVKLDFSNQISGGNGIHAVEGTDDFTVEGVELRNPAGDGIRATGAKNITMRQLSVIWDTPKSSNGGYGLYPVKSQGVLVEDTFVAGASDSGIYVGQSSEIIVQRNEVTQNVAGIEIENSTDALVFDNHCYDNTGGILVFNLPTLPVKDGKRTLVLDNLLEDNNHDNFAEPGNMVAIVPPGTGVMILASDFNEVTGNIINNNVSIGVAIAFYDQELMGTYDDPAFDPYAEGNFIHDNQMQGNATNPKGIVKAIMLEKGLTAPIPPLLWDGCFDANKDNSTGLLTNCFVSNEDAAGEGVGYLNAHLCSDEAASTDATEVTCEHPTLNTRSLP